MADDVQAYIEEARRTGMKDDAIRLVLTSSGRSEEKIDKAFAAVAQPHITKDLAEIHSVPVSAPAPAIAVAPLEPTEKQAVKEIPSAPKIEASVPLEQKTPMKDVTPASEEKPLPASVAATPLHDTELKDELEQHRVLDTEHVALDRQHAEIDAAHLAEDRIHEAEDRKHRILDRMLLIVAAIAVVAASTGLYLYIASRSRISDVESKLSETKSNLAAELEKYGETRNHLQTVQSALGEAQDRLKTVESRVGDTKPAEQIFSETRPAVVRIGMKIEAHITYPEPSLKQSPAGGLDFVPTTVMNTDTVTGVKVGTGFVVTANGHIITNAHVVDISKATLENDVRDIFSNQILEGLLTLLPQADEATIIMIRKRIMNYMDTYGTISDLKAQTAVFNPAQKQGTLDDYITKGFPVGRAIKMGKPWPQKGTDLAVIKPEKFTPTAHVSLSSAKEVQQGSRVYVLGYPAIADLNDSGNVEPTFTEGVVSAIKRSSEGNYNVVQIDAVISAGNSGGPALDAKGNVIGVATFAATDLTGYGWILPIELAKGFLDDAKVAY